MGIYVHTNQWFGEFLFINDSFALEILRVSKVTIENISYSTLHKKDKIIDQGV
jgi:hypothetical protein